MVDEDREERESSPEINLVRAAHLRFVLLWAGSGPIA